MSVKSIIQIIILTIIFVILGGVYFEYFSKDKVIIEEKTEVNAENQKLFKSLTDKWYISLVIYLMKHFKPNIDL